jgi:uracil-DNA glycosylase
MWVLQFILNSSSQPVGCNPFGKLLSPKIFTLKSIPVAELQLCKNKKKVILWLGVITP